ncbi:hypothetical protein PAXRUDRAFT_823664 [Paxillus rubicundulus Ve08.2h10]|uniref:HTH cro/C1-type domain-containing protein n=1 Tax=Paxillus rubicundulus Ve08.2h10 TaxID=930991 RepID=A0A0D0E386_9AGAM|nr:hypothetical protein PAXRUDRAFT_823664 [Paxillus rubicundulus Ve08.2h10]
MAQSHQCAAVAGAMQRKGLSYAQIATQIGSTEQRVQQLCKGEVHPSQAEFNGLAQVLGLTNAPSDAAHRSVQARSAAR